jgi:L-malate glycosyltransferase
MRILHITPHLGAGVGKALSTLVTSFAKSKYLHSFILLEKPDKNQFLEIIKDSGCEVYIRPSSNITKQLISSADIVQIEWWNHPAIFQLICSQSLPKMRLLIWCHVSGLHTPIIPTELICLSNFFLFSSACSYKAENVIKLSKEEQYKLGIVSSGSGIVTKRKYNIKPEKKISYGYMGSINPGKIHPKFISYLSKINIPKFSISMWGDAFYIESLISECKAIGMDGLIKFKGYSNNPAESLASLDVFVYLLNPSHYGTAENVLLEAMSMGVVPIVLNNPAEMTIVLHGETGLVVSNPEEFVDAVLYLENNPEEITIMSKKAVDHIAEHYSSKQIFLDMSPFYDKCISYSKKTINFKRALGETPYDWYLASQEKNISNVFPLAEETKGSLNHYIKYFPDNDKLLNMAGKVKK